MPHEWLRWLCALGTLCLPLLFAWATVKWGVHRHRRKQRPQPPMR